MTTDSLARAWQDFRTKETRLAKWIAPVAWVVMSIDLIHRFQTGTFAGGISNIGVIVIMSGLMVGPQCFGIIEAKSGSNSQKALAIITLFGFLILVTGLLVKLFALWR